MNEGTGTASAGDSGVRIVLIHGGMHDSSIWQRVTPLLTSPAVAVDLPGRSGAGPWPVTMDGWARSVAAAAGGSRALLVAHSLGGLAALAALGPLDEQVAGIILATAAVPAAGQCYWDSVPSSMARPLQAWCGPQATMPGLIARVTLCNGLCAADTRWLLEHLVPEPASILSEPVEYRIPDDLDLTYVRARRDRMIPPRQQQRFALTLPDRTHSVTIDCGHSITVARPAALASIVNDTARRLAHP